MVINTVRGLVGQLIFIKDNGMMTHVTLRKPKILLESFNLVLFVKKDKSCHYLYICGHGSIIFFGFGDFGA